MKKISQGGNLEIYVPEPGDNISVEQFISNDKPNKKVKKEGITKKDFFKILDKASQPIKHEAQSDSEKSET